MSDYKKVKVEAGPSGWGGPLEIQPTDEKKYIVCITGGGIHPVAQKIADLTGAEAFDGFKSSPEGSFKAMACAVIDCGGTARIGVYPMKGKIFNTRGETLKRISENKKSRWWCCF